MQTLISDYKQLTPVTLPWQGRQHYMHAVDAAKPEMLEGYEDYTPIVAALLRAAGVNSGTAFVTVDEKIVQAGMSQRRPGPHVDGCFMPTEMKWGSGWNHYCNNVPFERMAIIVAASVPGCKAWRGEFDAEPRNDGDLSHLNLDDGEMLRADMGYLLSPDCVHESVRFSEDTKRTFLRIALPVGAINPQGLVPYNG